MNILEHCLSVYCSRLGESYFNHEYVDINQEFKYGIGLTISRKLILDITYKHNSSLSNITISNSETKPYIAYHCVNNNPSSFTCTYSNKLETPDAFRFTNRTVDGYKTTKIDNYSSKRHSEESLFQTSMLFNVDEELVSLVEQIYSIIERNGISVYVSGHLNMIKALLETEYECN